MKNFIIYLPKMIFSIAKGENIYHKLFRFYFLTILVGAVILSLPISKTIINVSFVDMLFYSASTFSDTGFNLYNINTDFTFFGQAVIFLLLQIGGISLMAVKISAYLLVRRKISLKEKLTVTVERGNGKIGSSLASISVALKVMFCTQLVATIVLCIWFRFSNNYYQEFFDGNILNLIWKTIFFTSSAINNTGLDLFGSSSLVPFQHDLFFQIITLFLFILGGIGFPLFYEIKLAFQAKRAKTKFKFSLFAIVSISTYFIVFIIGILLFFLIEINNKDGFMYQNYTVAEKIFILIFNSASARNAGFHTIDLNILHSASLHLFAILMWLGASPASTGGGIRTTTFAIAIYAIISYAKGRKQIEINHRSIPQEIVNRTITIICFSFFIISVATGILLVDSSTDFQKVLFEVISAFGTTGLSLGITEQLGTLSKLILIFIMFTGQAGITIMLYVFINVNPQQIRKKYPEEYILIG